MVDTPIGFGNPLIQSGVIAGAGIMLLAFKHRRTAFLLIGVALAWVWLCSTSTFAITLQQGLANRYPPRPIIEYPHASAIVLVGGGPLPRSLDTWNAAIDPALSNPLGFALALYQSDKAPLLITTGSYSTGPVADALKRQGVPSSALHFEPTSQTTHEDAVYSSQALQPGHGRIILLVTTGTHMPRTVATFQKQGFNVIPAPPQRTGWTATWPKSLWPHGYALRLSQSCLHEYIGMFYYRLRGWATW